MAARRRTRRELPPDDDEELDDDLPARRRRPRRRWRLLLFLAIIVALVIVAPKIIAKSPLRNLVLSRALEGAPAQLAAQDASFNWTGDQALAGVTLTDAQGTPIATVEQATLQRSLIGLLSNSRQLGKLIITSPVIHLETRVGSSNLEELANALAQAAQKIPPVDGAPSPPPSIEIEIIDGQILGRDATTGQQWRIDQLAATAATSPTGGLADLTATGVLTLGEGLPGSGTTRLAADDTGALSAPLSSPSGRFKLHLTPSATGEHRLDLIADRLPLAPLEPWLSRVLPDARLTGATSADLKLAWSSHKTGDGIAGPTPDSLQPPASSLQPRLSATGKLDLADVRFSAAALQGDLLEVPTGAVAIDAAIDGGRLNAKQFTARCGWLEADATGDFNLAQFANGNWRDLPTTDASLTARVDLPQLARMFPRTLQLRPNVHIDSGKLEFTATSAKGVAGVESASPQGTKSNSGGGEDADPRRPNASSSDPNARRWTVAVVIEDLLGTDGQREIRWTKPVEAGLDAAETSSGPQLTRAIFRSAFGAVTAEAVDEGFQGQLDFNLAELGEQVGQFVDLTQWKLAGTGKGRFTLRNTGEDRFVATSLLNLKQIDVRQAGRVVWVDPELRLELNAEGFRNGLRPQRIEKAAALMRSPRDTLEGELLEPVDLAAPQSQWAVRIKGNGPLESFAGRLRPWIEGVPDELSGTSNLAAELRTAPGLVNIVLSEFNATDLRTRLGGVELYEPQVEAHGDFRWDAGQRIVESRDLTFASSTVAGRARGVSIRLTDTGPPTVRGEVALRGDLERINAWLGRGGTPGALIPRGQAVGIVKLTSDAGRASADVTLTAEPLTLVRALTPSASRVVPDPGAPGAPPLVAPAIAWSEPRLEFNALATYTNADDKLELANFRLTGQTVQMTGNGSIDQLRTAGLVRGDVNVTYDAAQLAKLLAGYLGPGVQFQGANQARLTAQGRLNPAQSASGVAISPVASGLQSPASSLAPHWSRQWQVTTEAGWTAANLYGLPIGPARLAANVRDGQIQLAPLDLAVGQGRVTAQPRVLLDPPPGELQLAAGPLVSNVAISQEVSESMLKYAAPMLANATRTSGTFSVFLDSMQTPLGDPRSVRAAGRVTIHQLSILPGPMLADVVRLISQIEALSKRKPQNLLDAFAGQPQQPAGAAKGITMTERTIDVQVVDGRVYHRNLEFMIDDVPVRSYGSVGFDQTLAIVIEVPIQAKWVGSERALQPLIGQVVQIPVNGTFQRWNIDERAVGNFLGQAAQTAVGGAIEGEVGKALDKLFKPR